MGKIAVVIALMLQGCNLQDLNKSKGPEKAPEVQINPHAIYIEVRNNESAPGYRNLDWDENVRAFITEEIYRQANLPNIYHCAPNTVVVRDEKKAATKMVVSYGISGARAGLNTASIQLVDAGGQVRWVISNANYFSAVHQAATRACGASE